MSKKIGKLAKRYARALLAAMRREMGTTATMPTAAQRIAQQLQELTAVWEGNQEFSAALLSPEFKREDRRKALESIARASGLPEISIRFLLTVFDRERIGALPEIVGSFAQLADEEADVIAVTVETASSINSTEQQEIEASIKQQISGKPVFSWKIDPALLGGIVVRYSGRVLDGSLNGRLERLERSLLS
jgi:F-type H+-transporting ATPase subunit delta